MIRDPGLDRVGLVPQAVEFRPKTLFLGRVKTGMEDLAGVVVDADSVLSLIDVIRVESVEELDPVTRREQDFVALIEARCLDHNDGRTYDPEVEALEHRRFEALDVDLEEIDMGHRRIRQDFRQRTNGHHDVCEPMPLIDVERLDVVVERREPVMALELTKDHLTRHLADARGDELIPGSDRVLLLHQRIGIDVDTAPASVVEQPSHRMKQLVIAADIDVETRCAVANERPEVEIFPILRIRHEWPMRFGAHISTECYSF